MGCPDVLPATAWVSSGCGAARASKPAVCAMLLLFETAAGFALFKVLKEGKLKETEVRRVASATLYWFTPAWRAGVALRVCVLRRTCTRTLSRWTQRRRCVPSLCGCIAWCRQPRLLRTGRPPQVVKLKSFNKFDNTTDALAAATALVDSKLSKGALAGVARMHTRALHGGL